MTPLKTKIYIYLFIIFVISLSIKYAEADTTVDSNINNVELDQNNLKLNINGRRDETSETNAVETSLSKNETKTTTQSAQPTSTAQNTQPSSAAQNTQPSSAAQNTTVVNEDEFTKSIEGEEVLTLIANIYSIVDVPFKALQREFNKYSRENGLNIFLDLQLFSDVNNVVGYNKGDTERNTFFGGNKFEIIAYDAFYISRFYNYLLPLDNEKYSYIRNDLNRYQTTNNKMLTHYNGHVY